MKMLFTTEKTHLNLKNLLYIGTKKVVPFQITLIKKIFSKRRHITAATLFVALVVIEVMDVVLPLTVCLLFHDHERPIFSFSSNIFAILGL
jgi:hypothetical protein